MRNKFDFYEVVKVASSKPKHIKLNGQLGVVKGMAQNEETGVWSYGVNLAKKNGLITRFYEDEIVSTGERVEPTDFYTGESIKVRVDPKTGEGEIIDD